VIHFFNIGRIILDDVPKSYAGLKEYLTTHYIEGIVFYRNTGDMCKIKRTDFGLEWGKYKSDISSRYRDIKIAVPEKRYSM
jgi:hypothetical protein